MSLLVDLLFQRGFHYVKNAIYLILFLQCMTQADKTIKITQSDFKNVPKEFFYFDESNNILLLESKTNKVYLSENEGKSWDVPSSFSDVQIDAIHRHPFDNNRAIALTKSKKHYTTKDKGKSWKEFTTPLVPASGVEVFSFHSKKTSYIIFQGTECVKSQGSELCHDNAYYTTDFFSTSKLLYKDISKCIWGYSNKVISGMPDKMTFCIKSSDGSNGIEKMAESRLVRSKDFFESSKDFIDFDFDGIPDKGVIGISIAEKYLIAVVRKDISSENLNLFISKDGNIWAQAHIPNHKSLSQNSFTVLDSTVNSLTLAVGLSSTDKFATLYSSNSNGTYFTESLPFLDMDHSGYVAMERVKGLEHLLIANIVSNSDAVKKGGVFSSKEIKTKITYNNGGEWSYILPPKKDCQNKIYNCVKNNDVLEKCSLHFQSIQDFRNIGPLFSRASSPGFLIGVGNVGNSLNSYSESDTFFSRDGGVSWDCARPSPHKYIIGDMGSLLVLIKDSGLTKKIIYSYNQGTSWNEKDLPTNVKPTYLTTEKASTSQNALLFGKKDDGSYITFHLDFSGFHNRKCDVDSNDLSKSKDLELWYPKSNENGVSKESCIMGHKIGYYRKKPDAECYIGEKFKAPETQKKDCPCSEEDFECDYNFVRADNNTCVLDGIERLPRGACSGIKTFLGSSGYRLIPENTCSKDMEGAKVLDKPYEKPCSSVPTPDHPSGTIRHTRKELLDSKINHYNFPASDSFFIWGQHGLWFSQDSGLTWSLKFKNPILAVIGHKYDGKIAYVLSKDKTSHITTDQGKTFKDFKLPSILDNSITDLELIFNYKNNDHIILQQKSNGHSDTFITKNNGASWDSLIKNANKCIFASTQEFSIPENQILCSRPKDDKATDFELVVLNFESEIKVDRQLSDNVDQFNIIGPRLFVASFKDDNANLQVAEKSLSLSSIQLPPGVQTIKNGYVVHDSLNSHSESVFLTLLNINSKDSSSQTFSNTHISIGSFYTSNINGTSYSLSLPDIAVKDSGLVALQEVSGIRGISIANQILEADKINQQHRVQTSITFDNGGSWNRIPAPAKMFDGSDYNCKKDECHLNLQLFHEDKQSLLSLGLDNGAGRVLAVGSVGTHLLPIEKRKTYTSQDAGKTWTEILASRSIYAMSDSGNLMLFVNEFPTTSLLYSFDGINTEKYAFSDDPIWVTEIITSSTGESLKFLIFGYVLSKSDPSSHHSEVITVDFTKFFSRQCVLDEKNQNDFETWSPTRLVSSSDKEEAKSTNCFLGQTLKYWRKKSKSDCYVGHNSKSQKIKFETCTCSEIDFECDFGYWRSDYGHGDCILRGRDPKRPSDCPLGTNYTSDSGYRKNPSTVCSGGVDLTKSIQRPCHEVAGIDSKQTIFDSDLAQYFYFKNSTALLVRLNDGSVKISHNEGYSFHDLLDKDHEKVFKMFHHTYIDDTAIFMTNTKTHYLTHNEGRAHTTFKTPLTPNTFGISHFEFHPTEASWFIFVGEESCDGVSSDCHSKAFITKDSGQNWKELGKYIAQCSFAWTLKFQKGPKERIFCEMYSKQSGSQKRFSGVDLPLKYSDDFFASSHTVLDNTIHFSMFYEFMVVATPSEDKAAITIQISTDGENFSPAKYPPNVAVKHDSFTVAESDTHSIVLHVTTNSNPGQEMGPLLLSNSNGTLFTLSLGHVNQNKDGLVDFEKMAGVEGIALANQVTNPQDVKLGASKKIASHITFDNGATWQTLSINKKDSQEKDFSCKGTDCTLHLHSFTERSDPENIFSSPAAVGMMIGVGNYGKQLGAYSLSNTYFTNNAGKDWFEIKKGLYRHEFGDSGGIILLASDGPDIDEIIYSQDMGLNFKSFKFGAGFEKIRVLETAVEPQSTSQKLIVLGHTKNDNKFAITYFDFTGLQERKCIFDSKDNDKNDYELWGPSSSRDSTCLFGRNIQYYRRKRDRKCSIDKKYQDPVTIVENCPCTREDFECDFNFSLNSNNECVLIPGLEIPQTSCANGQDAYTRSTGYRKLPISSCQGGKDLSAKKEIWCPGRGLSGWSIAFMVIIPLSGLGVLLYAFIRKGARRPIHWDRLFQSMLPYLCFIPAMVVSCIYGQGQNFFTKLRDSFNQMQGYAPVSQYDYDLDEDYLDGPVEVQLEDYDHDHLEEFEDLENGNGNEQSRLI